MILQESQSGPYLHDTSGTLRAGKDNFQTVIQIHGGELILRRPTPTEHERLMGWPDGWTQWGLTDDGKKTELTRSHRNRICGNGIPEPFTRWIGSRIGVLA